MGGPNLETQKQMAKEAVRVKRDLTENLSPQTMQRIERQLDRALERYLADRRGKDISAPKFRADLTATLRRQFPELAQQSRRPKAKQQKARAPAETTRVREKTAYVLGTVELFSGRPQTPKQNQITVKTSLNEQDIEAAVQRANAALQSEFGDQYSAIMRGPNGDIFAKRALQKQGIEVTGGNVQNYMLAMDAIDRHDPAITSQIRRKS